MEAVLAPRLSTEATEYLRTTYQRGLDWRERYDPYFIEIAKMFNPTLQEWDEDPNDIDAVDLSYLYDAVGWKASSKLSDAMHGYSFGRNTPWLRLATEDPDLLEDDDVAAWLQKVEAGMYRQFARSNFYDEGRLAVRTCADFGTAIMFREYNDERMMPTYTNLNLARCVIFEDENGEVDVLFRDVWMSPRQAVARFGLEYLPETIKDAYREASTRFYPFVHAVFPARKFDIDIEQKAGKSFTSVYFAMAGDRGWSAVRHSGYDTKPMWAWRWSRNPDGSPWGCDNPGMVELSTVKQLQGMRKDYHRLIQQQARPQIKASETLKNRINLAPNGVTYLRPGEDYAKSETTGDPRYMMQDIATLREEVSESYYNKLFLVLTQNLDASKRTATEIEAIRSEQSALLTAVSGRMNTELLECAAEDLYELEKQYRRIPPPPRRLANRPLKIDLVSPLAILQKRYLRLDTTRQALQELFSIAQMAPDALDHFDLGQYGRMVAETYNIDRTVLRDLLDVEKIRRARAQQQQAMMEAQQQELQARAAGKLIGALNSAPEQGSPLSRN